LAGAPSLSRPRDRIGAFAVALVANERSHVAGKTDIMTVLGALDGLQRAVQRNRGGEDRPRRGGPLSVSAVKAVAIQLMQYASVTCDLGLLSQAIFLSRCATLNARRVFPLATSANSPMWYALSTDSSISAGLAPQPKR
jgi:hypothetical protein